MIVGFVFVSANKGLYVFHVQIWCDLFHRLFDKEWRSVDSLNFGHLFCPQFLPAINHKELRFKGCVEVDLIAASIRILRRIGWIGLLRWFEKVFCCVASPWFFWGLGLLDSAARILHLVVCSKPLVWLYSPAWDSDAVELGCKAAVYKCHRLPVSFCHWWLSDKRQLSFPKRTLDALLRPRRRISCLLPSW